jgi:hypothetical protein
LLNFVIARASNTGHMSPDPSIKRKPSTASEDSPSMESFAVRVSTNTPHCPSDSPREGLQKKEIHFGIRAHQATDIIVHTMTRDLLWEHDNFTHRAPKDQIEKPTPPSHHTPSLVVSYGIVSTTVRKQNKRLINLPTPSPRESNSDGLASCMPGSTPNPQFRQ